MVSAGQDREFLEIGATTRATCPELDSLAGPLASLLVAGGDSRLTLNPVTMTNRYGCRPAPDPEALTFASSTATNISSRGFAAAAAMRQQLLHCADEGELQDACNDQAEKLRAQLRTILKLDASVEVVFSPSGTDSEIHAVYVARTILGGSSPGSDRLVSVIVAADETGSGVAQAALGRHFSSATSQGMHVLEGERIPGFAPATTSKAIPVRDSSGTVRSNAVLDGEVMAAVSQSLASGRRVILHAMDHSKLGWRCPSLDCLRRIQQNWGRSVQVVVDACQLRLGRERLAYYLNQGFMVLITGSKYFAGPPFSGALLIPGAFSHVMEQLTSIPEGLKCYSTRTDWPIRWGTIRSNLTATPNLGQLLRWAAAIEELRAYFAVPAPYRSSAIQKFSSAVPRLLSARPNLQLLPGCPSLSADPLDEEGMATRTIFPFFLRRSGKLLSVDECGRIYHALHADLTHLLPSSASAQQRQAAGISCHVGQPVSVHHPLQGAASTLRISASAGLISDTWSATGEAASLAKLNQQLEHVRRILDKIDLLLEYLPLENREGVSVADADSSSTKRKSLPTE